MFYGFGYLVKWTESIWKKVWKCISEYIVFFALLVFASIVFNYDLYHCEDDVLSIVLRLVAGYSGNLVVLWLCEKHEFEMNKIRMPKIGQLSLEIYVTHVTVVGLMREGSIFAFFTVSGFINFSISLLLTTVFSALIIVTIKTIPVADFLLFGKNKKQQKVA